MNDTESTMLDNVKNGLDAIDELTGVSVIENGGRVKVTAHYDPSNPLEGAMPKFINAVRPHVHDDYCVTLVTNRQDTGELFLIISPKLRGYDE